MLVRRYEPRDFADCDWLQKSFYLKPASESELREKLTFPSWVALDQSWDAGNGIVGNIITCPYWRGIDAHECVHIWSIVVAAPYRGNGVGSLLMDAAEEHFAGQEINLFVEPTNRAAQFYKNRGYEEVHLWPGYYGLNQPASEMVKNL